jgi:hypothetical protein
MNNIIHLQVSCYSSDNIQKTVQLLQEDCTIPLFLDIEKIPQEI